MELRKFLAPEVIFGIDARLQINYYIKNYRTQKPLIVTDKTVLEFGWTKDIIELLSANGVTFSIFSNIVPNPRDYQVAEGAEFFRKEKCDSIIAIGGGSVLDCAKGIGIIVTNNAENISDFEGVDKLTHPLPPFFCISTTSGSASDVSQFAIITRTSDNVKFAIICKGLVPDVAFVDPIPLQTMSNELMAATTIDSLVHAIEAYVSLGSSAVTDIHAIEAIKIISQNLFKALENRNNQNYTEQLMYACYYAGIAFSNASLGTVHAMAHSLGGLLDLPHGQCNAMLLPFVVDYNFDSSKERYQQIIKVLRGKEQKLTKTDSTTYLKEFIEQAGISLGLSKFGVKSEITKRLAGTSILDPCNATNPRTPTESEIENIFKKAL